MLHLLTHPGLILTFRYHQLPDGRRRTKAILSVDLYPVTQAVIAQEVTDCSLDDRFSKEKGRTIAVTRLSSHIILSSLFGAASEAIANDVGITYEGRKGVKQTRAPRDFRSGLRWLEIVCLERLRGMDKEAKGA